MTRISKAGTSNKGWRADQKGMVAFNRGVKGFTLLELIVVMAVVSAVAFIVFPKIPYLEGFSLHSDVRRVSGLLRYLDGSASSKKIYYSVVFKLKEGTLEVESSRDGIEFKGVDDPALKGFTLSEETEIQDIVVEGSGKINHGEASVVFTPGAGALAFALHLKGKDRTLTVSYNPYSGRVRVADGYI